MINTITIRKYTGSINGVSQYEDIQISNDKIQQVKITEHKHEEMDTAEIIFLANKPEIIKTLSNVSINDEPYNWLVNSASFNLIDPVNKIYMINVQLIEYTYALVKRTCPNLSFNKLVDSSLNFYPNLYSVVNRVNLLCPTEKEENLAKTRVVDLDENGNTLVSDKLREILEGVTEVKEFNFTGRNMYEVYAEILSLVGGVPRLYRNAQNQVYLDIELFTDGLVNQVNINNHFSYEGQQQAGNYATRGVLETSSIIDQDSNYTHGLVTGRLIQADDIALVDDAMSVKLEIPIYRLVKAEMKATGSNDWRDITQYVKDKATYDNLRVDREAGVPTKQNCVYYDIGGKNIQGWGEEVRGNTYIFSTSKFRYISQDAGLNITNLRNVVMRIEYEGITENNKLILTQQNLDDDNQLADVRINSGERVNEMNRVLNTTLNKLERLGQQIVVKKVRHNDGTDPYILGSYDNDSELYISTREISYTKNDTTATYMLTKEVNILSEYVGVNAENRPYDIVIGGGLVRQEQHNDWILVDKTPTEGQPDGAIISNESAMNPDFIRTMGGFIVGEQVGNKYSHLLTYSSFVPNRSILAPEIKAGRGMINWEMPYETQTYSGNSIIDSDNVNGIEVDMEVGIPYTDGNGQLDRMAMSLTENINEVNQQFELRTLPDADLFLDFDNYEPLWDIGGSALSNDLRQDTWTGLGGNITNTNTIASTIVRQANNDDTTNTETYSYTLSTPRRMSSVEFPNNDDWGISVDSPYVNVSSLSATATGGLSMRVRLYSALGVLLEQTEFVSIASGSVTANNEVRNLRIELEGRRVTFDRSYVAQRIEIDFRVSVSGLISTNGGQSVTTFMRWLLVNYTQVNVAEGEEIYIDKNPTELLRPSYQVNLQSLTKDIIIGESLTTKAPFLNNGIGGFDRIEIVKNALPYTVRDVNKISGTTITDARIFVSDTDDYNKITIASDELNDGDHIGIIGILNNQRYLLLANNNYVVSESILLTYKHFNPKLVYKW